MEDRVENGTDGPARLVKLKKRQLNESLFDSKNWEKLHGEVFGNSFARV